MKKYIASFICAFLLCTGIIARDIQVKETLDRNTDCTSEVDLHLTSSTAPMKEGVTVNLVSREAWLFYDNMKPSEVLRKYGQVILINGEILDPAVNARVGMYKQGAVIMPHADGFQPLEVFPEPDFRGASEKFSLNKYYSNKPSDSVAENMREPLVLDNKVRSFKLKRGYMATFANEPDGMGYSRVFIADDKDLELAGLPELLDGKISFVRVFKWEYASKKGWAGSVWKEMVPGLKYVEEQCAITNSTWYYNWGASTGWTTNPDTKTPNYDVEFIPEKWGAGGSWGEVFGVKNASHLMGYNEPDHKEQSNVTVEKAIQEWPLLIQTGMRLGSPATTDFSWLYSFMSECNKRNYRVDYVVVHAYWASLSPAEWYSRLKEVHERTGRPIWIKEWNNGANWTNESWPGGTEAQQAKQLNDLKGILQVMDTASFIERYSIYNWVEDKRAMLLKTGKLTPAGEYYAKNSPDLAFARNKEVISNWEVREAPVVSYRGYDVEKGYTFSFSDYNGELIDRFVIERAFTGDGQESSVLDYQQIATLPGAEKEYTDVPVEGSGRTYYRVRSVDYKGKEKTSNVIGYMSQDNAKEKSVTGLFTVNTPWSLLTVAHAYEQNPVVVLGASSFINKSPLSTRVRNVSLRSFEMKLAAYDYLENPVYIIPDTVAYMALPAGSYDWGGISAQAATVEHVGRDWKTVSFETPFEVVPVVFPTQITDEVTVSSAVRVRNVTKEGFEVSLQYEKGFSTADVSETISYLAVTPGKGAWGNRKIEVGRTPDASVGDERTGLYRIEYSETYKNSLFFGSMQTESDGVASALRIYERSDAYAEVLKDYERSGGAQAVKKETVGWMVVGEGTYSDIGEVGISPEQLFYDPSTGLLSLENFSAPPRIAVYSVTGMKLLEQTGGSILDLTGLLSGVYVVKANAITQKLIKQ